MISIMLVQFDLLIALTPVNCSRQTLKLCVRIDNVFIVDRSSLVEIDGSFQKRRRGVIMKEMLGQHIPCLHLTINTLLPTKIWFQSVDTSAVLFVMVNTYKNLCRQG